MTIAIALALCAVGAALSLATSPRQRSRWAAPMAQAAWWVVLAACVTAVLGGALSLSGRTQRLGLGESIALGPAALRMDRLSGLFAVISFSVAIPALLAALPRAVQRPRLAAAVSLLLGSVLVIETADQLFALLFGWECLTAAFYLLVGYDRRRPGRASASVAAAFFGKTSGAALLVGGLLLAAQAHSLSFSDLTSANGSMSGPVAYALLLLGFGIKVGLVPLQVWLPPAYAAAPGPARPLMAGAAVNVGFYGMWRTLLILGVPPTWLVVAVLVVAGVTALLGIAHAAVNPDLAGLISWSSVENAGVITAGFGVALIGAEFHDERLTALGLVAGTAQAIAHAIGKTLLFVSASAIEDAAQTTELDGLRGVTRGLPYAGAGLVLGSLTLAGLPLTAGFASEWLTLESLMQQFRVSSLPIQLASATAGALVALTVGVAGVTFVRLIALTAFGRPSTVPPLASERSWAYRLAVALLGAAALGVAAAAPWEMRVIGAGLSPIVGQSASGVHASAVVLQPVYPHFSALSPTLLWIVLPAMSLVVLALAGAVSRSRLWQVRRVPAWSSASPGVERGVGYTSSGYANPMRRVLANLLLPHSSLEEARRPGTPATGQQPGSHTYAYEVDVVEVVEHFLYRPLQDGLMRLVRLAKRLQSGRLDAYVAYMLIVLVAVLAIVTATA